MTITLVIQIQPPGTLYMYLWCTKYTVPFKPNCMYIYIVGQALGLAGLVHPALGLWALTMCKMASVINTFIYGLRYISKT